MSEPTWTHVTNSLFVHRVGLVVGDTVGLVVGLAVGVADGFTVGLEVFISAVHLTLHFLIQLAGFTVVAQSFWYMHRNMHWFNWAEDASDFKLPKVLKSNKLNARDGNFMMLCDGIGRLTGKLDRSIIEEWENGIEKSVWEAGLNLK